MDMHDETHDAKNRGPVALVGLAPPDLECARDAVELAGARVCSNPARALLVLASTGAPVPVGVPCVRVGGEGQVSLPGDTALLVSLIAEACHRWAMPGAVWVVAGICGGWARRASCGCWPGSAGVGAVFEGGGGVGRGIVNAGGIGERSSLTPPGLCPGLLAPPSATSPACGGRTSTRGRTAICRRYAITCPS